MSDWQKHANNLAKEKSPNRGQKIERNRGIRMLGGNLLYYYIDDGKAVKKTA